MRSGKLISEDNSDLSPSGFLANAPLCSCQDLSLWRPVPAWTLIEMAEVWTVCFLAFCTSSVAGK